MKSQAFAINQAIRTALHAVEWLNTAAQYSGETTLVVQQDRVLDDAERGLREALKHIEAARLHPTQKDVAA